MKKVGFMKKDVYTIEEIKKLVIPALSELGVKKVGVFGSYAKGIPNIKSDVDLLVSLPDEFDVLQYYNVETKLRELLHKKVDILEYRCIADYMKSSILEGSVTIYEKE